MPGIIWIALIGLIAGLIAWIALPWIGVLAVALLLVLWLLLTRSGRLALAAARVGLVGDGSVLPYVLENPYLRRARHLAGSSRLHHEPPRVLA